MVDSRESWQNVHCDLWKSQAHTEILRPCRGAIIEAAVLKSGLLGERDMCKVFLLLGKSAVTYYANLQGNEWITVELEKRTGLANASIMSTQAETGTSRRVGSPLKHCLCVPYENENLA